MEDFLSKYKKASNLLVITGQNNGFPCPLLLSASPTSQKFYIVQMIQKTQSDFPQNKLHKRLNHFGAYIIIRERRRGGIMVKYMCNMGHMQSGADMCYLECDEFMPIIKKDSFINLEEKDLAVEEGKFPTWVGGGRPLR